MPTFTRDDTVASNYISSFADNIYQVINIDEKIARQSLVNILNVSIPIQKSDKEKASYSTFGEKRLDEKINESLHIEESLSFKTFEELNKYFNKYDKKLDDKDMIFLTIYINELADDELAKNILLSIIQKEFGGTGDYYENLRFLIKSIKCNEELKIFLFVNIFIYSKGGWYENFVNKEALKDAVNINQSNTLKYLAEALEKKFQQIYYYAKSTANLVIAFEYAGLASDDILSMYKRGFKFIEYRLPHSSNFEWQQIEDKNIEAMNDDEIALAMMFSKMRNFDVSVQREIILAVNYMMNHDCNLLIKPLQWLFAHIQHFPHLSIAGLFELFLLYVESKQEFFQQIRDDLIKVESLKNLTIQKNLHLLLEKVANV
jgi:hypothetical protein